MSQRNYDSFISTELPPFPLINVFLILSKRWKVCTYHFHVTILCVAERKRTIGPIQVTSAKLYPECFCPSSWTTQTIFFFPVLKHADPFSLNGGSAQRNQHWRQVFFYSSVAELLKLSGLVLRLIILPLHLHYKIMWNMWLIFPLQYKQRIVVVYRNSFYTVLLVLFS